MSRVIPIKLIGNGPQAVAEDAQARAHARLERAGFMRMMTIGDPRLSEFVEKYKSRGYEVEVLPADAEMGGETGQAFGTVYVRKRTIGDK